MSGRLAAAKALNDAQKAMTAAKSDGDRALAAARILAAEGELAKVTKTKTKDTTTHTEEVDSGSESSDDDSSEDSSSDASSSSGSSESASEDKDEEKAVRASDNAVTGLHTKDRLLRLCRQIVGSATSRNDAGKSGSRVMSIEEVMGALHATWQAQKGQGKLAAEVASLKADADRTKLSALIDHGMKAGKIAPSQKAWAKTQSPAALKAYLDAAPKMVHTVDGEHTESRIEGVGPGGVTAEMAKIWRKQGFAEKDFPALLAKMNGTTTTNGAS